MNHPTMIYRCPGPHITDGIAYEYTIVDATEVEAKLAEGWHRGWHEAHAAMKAMEHGSEPSADLKAVHKGRGVWEVQDAQGNTVKGGLTKEEAQAAVG